MSSMISYKKIAEQTYEASDGTNQVTILYGWLRRGGYQWITSDQRVTGLTSSFRGWPTRKAAAEAALAILAARRSA